MIRDGGTNSRLPGTGKLNQLFQLCFIRLPRCTFACYFILLIFFPHDYKSQHLKFSILNCPKVSAHLIICVRSPFSEKGLLTEIHSLSDGIDVSVWQHLKDFNLSQLPTSSCSSVTEYKTKPTMGCVKHACTV